MRFECSLVYVALDPDSAKGTLKKFTDVIAMDAEDYTDAETIATQWGVDNIDAEFGVSPIKELNLFDVIDNENGGLWYKCTASYTEYTMFGKPRFYKALFLLQEEDICKAAQKAEKEMKNIFGECNIVKIEETPIKEFIAK